MTSGRCQPSHRPGPPRNPKNPGLLKPRKNNQLQFFEKRKNAKQTQKHISVVFWRFLACFCPQVVGGFVLPSFEHQKYVFFLFATPGRKILLIRVATETNDKDLYMPPSRHTCYIRPKCPSSRHPTQPANRTRLHSRHPTQPAN